MAAAAAAAAATLERLEALACPAVALLVPLEPAEALRLLCTPSARRLALLEWVCSRVHPPLAARLEALQDGPKDARLRELAKLGAELMLCRADDVALVEGTAPPEQQLEFIRDLLDAAPPPGEEDGGSPKSRRSALHRTTRFLHEVLETPEGVAALSPPSPPPLPAFDDYGSPPPRRPRPSGPELEAALGATRQRLELLEAQSLEAVDQLGGTAAEVTRLVGGARHRAMETRVATLQQRFGGVPEAGGPPQD
ncbi:HAUS augmin-like complex subunit 7 isoform X4 [Mycteria americana]|uniref:HAUS augmin-like complex subunit 7 isoform X4 n=1 Tax=Mycteria americana TaxID=33587 RepID=UPI003F5809C5